MWRNIWIGQVKAYKVSLNQRPFVGQRLISKRNGIVSTIGRRTRHGKRVTKMDRDEPKRWIKLESAYGFPSGYPSQREFNLRGFQSGDVDHRDDRQHIRGSLAHIFWQGTHGWNRKALTTLAKEGENPEVRVEIKGRGGGFLGDEEGGMTVSDYLAGGMADGRNINRSARVLVHMMGRCNDVIWLYHRIEVDQGIGSRISCEEVRVNWIGVVMRWQVLRVSFVVSVFEVSRLMMGMVSLWSNRIRIGL